MMKKPLSKRLLSLLCAMTLVCGMATPGVAAEGTESPFVSEGHTHTASEAPAAQTPELLDAAASGAYVVRPDADAKKGAALFAAPRAGQTVHAKDFSNGIGDSFFTISGNTSSSKGTVNYNGNNYTTCLKMESSTNISFTAPYGGGTLTLVFGESAATLKLDGTKKTASNGVFTATIDAGSHTVTKADSANLFYMELVAGPACEHLTTQKIPAVAATCTTDGSTEGEKCTVCGTVLIEPEVIPAGHKMENPTRTKEPTCGQPGEQTATCSVCHQTVTEPIPPTGNHTWSNGVCTVCGSVKTSFTKQSGWLESAFIEWPIESGVSKYTVSIQKEGESGWTPLDPELVREYPGKMRADAVGLAAGNYKLKVMDNKGGEMISDTLKVLPHDRSGYAFVSGSTIPGAYNADGTLKAGAKVVYVTDENKDTVTVPGVDLVDSNKNPLVGVANIVQFAYKKKDNTTPPIAIRFIGNINDPANMPKGDLYLDGSNKCAGLTLEGIGNDTVLNGFGVVLKNSSYVELRNLGLMNCDSSEGDDVGLQQDNDHIWVHNCDFFYGGPGGDSDQAKGDGALDTKKSTFVTHSYNHFWDCGKCNLQGMKDEVVDNRITYHHNWFDHSDSRHPRIRTCTVHIYNNYYDGNAKYGVGVTLGSSAFVESNYFRGCKHPMLSSKQGTDALGEGTFSGENGGIIKAYGNTIIGGEPVISYAENNTSFDAYMASSRDEKVPAAVKTLSGGTGYSNFDTAADFYQYEVQTPEDAVLSVTAYAGRVEGGDLQYDFDDATEDDNYAVISELKSALTGYKTTLVSVGGGVKNSSAAPIDPDTCKHNWSTWKVVVAATATEKGREERTCLLCGKVEEREVPAGGSSGGSGSSGNGNTLKYSDFSVSDPSKDKTSINDKIADVANGYFTLYGKADKIQRRSSSSTNFAIDFIDLPMDSTSQTTVPAGIQFSVKNAPATVKVTASSTSKTGKTSKFALYKLEGSTLTEVPSTATQVDKNVGDAQIHSFRDIPAGTYVLAAVPSSPNNVRLRELSVSEAATEPAPGCTHANKVNVAAVPATCQKAGATAGVKCADCGKLLSGCEPIAKLTHNYKLIIPGVEPTCVKNGVTDTYECTLCGDRYGNRAVNKLGHDYGSWVRVDGDLHMHVCRRPGCSEDTEGHTETAEHDWEQVGAVITSPCTGEIVTTYQCADCSISKQERTGGNGTGTHLWGDPEIIIPATCVEPGTSRVTCTRENCGVFENQAIPALGHDLVKVEAKAATCTVDGCKEHYACQRSNCGKLFLDVAGKTSVALKDVTIPAGHTYGTPAWTWEGYTKATAVFTCTACGADTEGHTLSLNASITSVTTKEPTSSAAGEKTYTAAVTLNKKDYTDVKTEVLPATGGSSGGGGGGGGGSSSSKPKPTPQPTETEKPKPKPEAPALNTEDHLAYITGFADGTVGGRRNISRQETAVIFYRLLTEQARKDYATDFNIFPDVADDYWANHEISTLINAGIIKGLPDGTFGPTQNITRAEFITIASRFFNVTTEKNNPFPDVAGHWAEREILFAYSQGWIKGLPDGTFAPNQFITRGEAVHIINGILGRKADAESIPADAANKWSDLTPADWFYYDMLEATTSRT